jgi:hypothetical protein
MSHNTMQGCWIMLDMTDSDQEQGGEEAANPVRLSRMPEQCTNWNYEGPLLAYSSHSDRVGHRSKIHQHRQNSTIRILLSMSSNITRVTPLASLTMQSIRTNIDKYPVRSAPFQCCIAPSFCQSISGLWLSVITHLSSSFTSGGTWPVYAAASIHARGTSRCSKVRNMNCRRCELSESAATGARKDTGEPVARQKKTRLLNSCFSFSSVISCV